MADHTGRDPEATRVALQRWLAPQLGVDAVEVADLKVPRAGFSNETVLGTARWRDAGGIGRERPFVLRIEASSHQLFQQSDALRQAAVMQGLAGRLPVPNVWLTSGDASVFGSPFFLMDRVDGRIPPDLPTWHAKGWATELSPAERFRVYDNGLAAMAALHRVDWRDGLAFLDPPGEGRALDRYLVHVRNWYDWAESARRVGAEVIDAAMEHVLAHRPDDDGAQVSWGDARPGNIVYGDDLSVAAVLDWEGATIGPPGIDVGWWLMFEEYLSDSQGVTRLDGVPGRKATIARYEEHSGAPVVAVDYYEILAGLVFALINSRLVELVAARGIDPSFGEVVVTRVTDALARKLAAAA